MSFLIGLAIGATIGVIAMGLVKFSAYQAALAENAELRRVLERLDIYQPHGAGHVINN